MNHEPRYISIDTAIEINRAMVIRFGGIAGVRDSGLLESSLAQPAQSFGGVCECAP